MTQKAPEIIKPLSFAKKNLSFVGYYQIKDFPRIRQIVSNIDDTVSVKLNFSMGQDKIALVKGEVKLALALICQRCLQAFKLPLHSDFKAAFVNEQQTEGLDPSFEAIISADEEFSIVEFLTDEILMSLPISPMHSFECITYTKTQFVASQKRENPFAILKQLKRTDSV